MNIEPIIQVIQTKQDQTAFLSGLDRFSQALFDVNESIPQKIDRFFEEPVRSVFRTFLKENSLPDDPIQLQRSIAQVKKEILNLPVVVLEIAIQPTPELIQSIQAWFKLSLKQHFITDIKVNKNIIGAVCITVNGLYKDYSVRKRLEGLNILEVLPN